MFRVKVTNENGDCRIRIFNTIEEAHLYPLSLDFKNRTIIIVEVSNVTYASLIHSLSEYNEDICPVYTLNNMTVDECFEYGLDLQDESWNDFARIEVYEQVMLELKELKEIFDKNTKDIKCFLTDLI